MLTLAALPATAQEAWTSLPAEALLVAPDGAILDYIPESGEVRAFLDRRGRTVLVDAWGNVVATVIEQPRANRRILREERRAARDYDNRRPSAGMVVPDDGAVYDDNGWGAPLDGGSGSDDYAYGSPDDGQITGSIPTFRDVVPLDVERSDLPSGMSSDVPNADPLPNDSGVSSIDPQSETTPQNDVTRPTIAITKKPRAEVTALQVFLDREGFSPGVIDGKLGGNVTKAVEAWQQATGETLDPNDTDGILERLRLNGGLPITSYEITAADAAGPYVASIPEDYAHKAMLPALSFTSTSEALAERFHMDEAYLRELNPGVDFTVPGTVIKVVNPGAIRKGTVTRIVADKARKQVFAYDAGGTLLAAYPATIGSSDTPSPSGTVTVERIAFNPGYTYNPKINFKQGNNDKVLTLQPGPNGPVGTVWIALSKPTYGIHGTPEPSKIGKTQSHGCIRLTNWDATELGKMVSKGVTVEFID